MSGRPLVEILYVDGCPNHEGARALVEQVSRELGVEPELRLVNVPVYRTESDFAGQPDERRLRDALERASSTPEPAPEPVEATLERAGIPPERRGPERVARLAGAERALYRWLLRSFAAGQPPAPGELVDAAATFAVDLEQALGALAAEDLVHTDPASGAVLVA